MSDRRTDDLLKELWARTDMPPAPKRIRTPQRQLVMGCLAAVVLPVFLGLFLNDLVNGPDLTNPPGPDTERPRPRDGTFGTVLGGGVIATRFWLEGEGSYSWEDHLEGWLRCRALGVENEDEDGPARFAVTIQASNGNLVIVDEVRTKAWGSKTAKFGPYASYLQPPHRIEIEAAGLWEVECKVAGWARPPRN